ncbi:nucleotidyl transferase AbiEii/AbiGii toxin family protein [Clostridium sp. UBA1652]|uniref:nucleotidyl transferase AbiEii/AbiGii toxin family protein n=1 Tax=Clostridium sp. UBA1652 TaxID=1946348 RepID=UPI00257C995A|nr:nucleotidyl transferase AbiEii/AbiGii toxin family protein [Clostridium sp. UBA1652]
MTKDISASVKAKLLNIARSEKRAFNTISLLYMQERLLYRLSISEYKEKFILKGGLLLFSINEFKGRPTRDIDFLAEDISNDLNNIEEAFKKICSIECEDGITYDIEKISVERIKEDAEYEGVRVKISSLLGKAIELIQIDIGFGDIVVPDPKEMIYPTLLNLESPKVMVYSKESIIAEKFEAMVSLTVFNSRMKDFYDIYTISIKEEFDYETLKSAISETFARRETNIGNYSAIFTEDFITDQSRINQWKTFLKRINSTEELEYIEVMNILKKFLEPIAAGILEEDSSMSKWNKDDLKWV